VPRDRRLKAGAPGAGGRRPPRRRPRDARWLHRSIDAGYLSLLVLAAPWAAARMATDAKARSRWRAYLRDLAARFGRRRRRGGDAPCAWVHGVSVGEIKAAARLVESIEREVPGVEVVVSATTDTGYRVARERFPGRRVDFYPPDVSGVVESALDRLRPDLVVLVESEFWPNFLTSTAERGIPVVLVNGKMSERSAARFRRTGPLGRRLLASLDCLCVQLPAYADRFRALGVASERIRVTGNLKLDNIPIGADRARTDHYASLLGLGDGRPLWVAGSTHPPEERAVGRVLRRLRADAGPLRLVVAPRHPSRADAVEADLRREGLAVVRRSAVLPGRPPSPDDVVLLDTVGELEALYALADVVFVGGSLVPHGGQNMMEPASLGKPVVVGPHTSNFRGEVDLLLGAGGLVQADDEDALRATLVGWLRDPGSAAEVGRRGREAILSGKGATERTVEAVRPWLARLATRAGGRAPRRSAVS
jgi:3-deoxy-D-manno-octulosonic-acid transferase